MASLVDDERVTSNGVDLDEVEFDEYGVHIEVDCPNCFISRDMILPWREIVAMFKGKPIRGDQMSAQRTRAGYRIALRCNECWTKRATEPPRQRRLASTIVLDFSNEEVDAWLAVGKKLLAQGRGQQPTPQPRRVVRR